MRRSAVLVGTAAILLSSACSSGGAKKDQQSAKDNDSSAAPAAAVRAAVAATEKSTVRIDERVDMSGEGGSFTFGIRGGMDLAGGKGHLTTTLDGAQRGGGGATLDEVFSGGTVYFRMPEATDGDTAWRAVPRDKVESQALLRAPMNDPAHTLRQIAQMRSPVNAGEEKVNGTPTVHYRGRLDHDTLVLRMAAERRAKVDSMRDMLNADLPVAADAWVDKAGRLVRSRLTFDMGGTKLVATLDFADFGKPVDTPAAPADAQAVQPADVAGPLTG
ncbi:MULTISPECIES: hypothetical protein [Streptomyces]|uniref:LppX_LprAFG lipoprotein n=1 Tax=Streptomyces luteosporeus TaxID=173856 RepID=A0ABP6GIU0_9ACTN